MQILYDISVLGLGYYHPKARTGVFRVVENVAERLVKHPDCNLLFCGDRHSYDLKRSLDYLENKKELVNIPFSVPPFLKKKFEINRQRQSKTISLNDHRLNSIKKPLIYGQIGKLRVIEKLYEIANVTLNRRKFLNTEDLTKAHIYHSPFYPIPKIATEARKVVFLTSYDLIPVLYPQFAEKNTKLLIEEVLKSITPDTWVLCISVATRNDLLNYLGKRVNSDRVLVTELAASDNFYKSTDKTRNSSAKKRYKIPDQPYILSLCTLEPRKNIDSVIRAFVQMVKQEHVRDLNLVLVGVKGWMFDKIFDELETNRELRDRIIITGYVADEDLSAIYSDAILFVYPSFYEGFGLPPLEAMQCGVPVITSNTSSLPEVVGDAGIMINPKDLNSLCASMLKVYKSAKLQTQMVERSLERAKRFSWERCVDETVNAYKLSLS